MNRRITLNRLAIALGITAVVTLQGCATPQGAAFTAPAATEPDKANVYLYRQSKLNSSGESLTMQLNDQLTQELANASFILMQVPKGDHLLKVKAGGFGKTYEHRWTAESGKTYYLEFVLPSLLLANPFNLGSEIVVREEVTARQDMQTLKGMK